jgi:hypothetical protein
MKKKNINKTLLLENISDRQRVLGMKTKNPRHERKTTTITTTTTYIFMFLRSERERRKYERD